MVDPETGEEVPAASTDDAVAPPETPVVPTRKGLSWGWVAIGVVLVAGAAVGGTLVATGAFDEASSEIAESESSPVAETSPSTVSEPADGGLEPVDDEPESGDVEAGVAAESTDSLVPTERGDRYVYTFDQSPDAPAAFGPPGWDITVHSRDRSTFDELEPVEAEHDASCGPPTETHTVTSYAGTAYICRDHMMTAINAGGYAMAYLTPDHMVDFTDGEAVIKFDISTLRSSTRDWWDVWITPFSDNLQLPLDLGSSVDATGPPERAIRVGLGTENQMVAEVYNDFMPHDFGEFPPDRVPGDWGTGYDTFLEPDRARRDTFEIRISKNRLRVGMPDYDFWWIDNEIPELDWSQGVVQFGHHSYNPTKDCGTANSPIPPVAECLPGTWHWDAFEIDPAVPFDIVRAVQRTATPEQPVIELTEAAPDGGNLRFTAIGGDVEVRFDGGDWIPAQRQRTVRETKVEHFTSYWMPIPAGTTSIEFSAENWYEFDWHVRDASVWRPPDQPSP